MTTRSYLHSLLVVAFATLAMSSTASASPGDYSGSFTRDDDRFVLSFYLDTSTEFVAGTTSWASGGFAPVLTLFGGAGGVEQVVGSSMTCDAGSGTPDPSTGFCWDARLSSRLDAGNYTLVLTQDGNLAIGTTLAEGFGLDGMSHYTSQFYLGIDSEALCINVDASQRSCAFALQVEGLGVADTEVPEPAVPALLAVGLLALGTALRRTYR